MTVVKIRFASIVKRANLDISLWSNLRAYIEETFTISVSSYKLVCTKPINCILKSQSDLDQISSYEMIELEIVHNEESLYSQIIKELLDMPSNKEHVIQRFVGIIKQFPSTSLSALIPLNLEPSIKEKLADFYRQANSRTEKKSAFRLVYVNEGGKQVLKGLPSSQWINYSTTNFDELSRSLPPNVIQKLNNI